MMARALLTLVFLATLIFSCTKIIVNTGELEYEASPGIHIEAQEAADSI